MATTERFFAVVGWEKYQDRHVRNPTWLKFGLDFFDDPAIHSLPGSMQLAFIAVLILCGKRGNRVPFDADYIKKRCSLRVTPDLPLLMAQGLIEEICCNTNAETPMKGREVKEEKREKQDSAAVAAPDAARPSVSAVVVRVFDHWRAATKRTATTLTAKRRRCVEMRLAEGYTEEQLLRAVDGYAGSPFHQGQNDRQQRYDELTLICRDGEHVEKFLEAQAPGLALVPNGIPLVSGKAQQRRSAADAFIGAGLEDEN